MKIALCTPCYDGRVHDAFNVSVVKTMMLAAERGIEILLIHGRGSPILPDARNWCVAEAMAAGCDKVWFVDSDIGWQACIAEALNMLLAPVEIVCGIHQARNVRWNDPARLVVRWKHIPPQEDPETGLWEVERVATAFVAIDVKVFERLAESGQARRYLPNGNIVPSPHLKYYRNYFWLSLDPVELPPETVAGLEALGIEGPYEILSGEDFYFCRWAKTVGARMFADPRIKLVHFDGCVMHDASLSDVKFEPSKLAHFYQAIPGWFKAQEVYSAAVKWAAGDAHFVEVGAWKGQSAAFMAVEIANSGKRIAFDVVDHFRGSDEPLHKADEDVIKGTLRAAFDQNIAPARRHIARVAQEDSVTAAAGYSDGELDFVFLDGAHDLESVKADIKAWAPKLKPGGVMAGDDYDWQAVGAAVDASFGVGGHVKRVGRCWLAAPLDHPILDILGLANAPAPD